MKFTHSRLTRFLPSARSFGPQALVATLCVAFIILTSTRLFAGTADSILKDSGVKGGFVVVIGCDDIDLLAGLRADEKYIVQGLDIDEKAIKKARAALQEKSLYGAISVVLMQAGIIPYVKDTVNLLVDEKGTIAEEEILRVLAPRGVALIKGKKITKPVSPDVDEWSHFLHDASGNAVAKDKEVGSPRSLRWVAGPDWCRSHEFGSSVNSVVTSGGRIFTIYDEGIVGIYKKVPQDVKLIARDAANGTLLWKASMPEWQPETGASTGGRWMVHHTVGRRIVAKDDRVYATVKFLDSPVTAFDAATGEVIHEALPETEGTDEIILSDGVLIVKTVKKPSPQGDRSYSDNVPDDGLVAVDTKTNKKLWSVSDVRVLPYSLSAQDGKAIYHNGAEFICLDLKSGKEIWKSTLKVPLSAAVGQGVVLINNGILVYQGVVEFPVKKETPKSGKPAKPGKKKKPAKPGKAKKPRKPTIKLVCVAMSMKDGTQLWEIKGGKGAAGACPQSDLFVINDTVWAGSSTTGLDLFTGKKKKNIQVDNLVSPGHHARCLRSKATEKFLIRPKRGAEFIDLEGDNHMRNDWLRVPCFSGATPANGLFYKPPDQCFCYPGVKVLGYMALSGDDNKAYLVKREASRLQKGPSYGKPLTSNNKPSLNDWPTHRNNNKRSGSTKMKLAADIKEAWRINLKGEGSQAVVVGNQLWIVDKDAHTVRCLSTTTGEEIWNYTAGGRIDSVPTISDGNVLFGCRDGFVYCLNAKNGELAWRFLAAPADKRIVSFEQPESLWPVHGSVLVKDGVVYFAAGRSSYLDGGIMVYGLDAATGEQKYHHLLEGPWPDITKDVGTPYAMEGALPDILVSDGTNFYMRRIKFDKELNRLDVREDSDLGELHMGEMHLAATGGMLDSSGFDRIYWMYSKMWPGFYFSNHAPKSGQILSFDETTTYATKYFYDRQGYSPIFIPGKKGYPLFADSNVAEPVLTEGGKKSKTGKKSKKGKKGEKSVEAKKIEEAKKSEKPKKKTIRNWIPGASCSGKKGGKGAEKGTGYVRDIPVKWLKMVDVRIRAMVLTEDKLFVAGTPDITPEDDPTAALEGRMGALLHVYSTKDGSLLKETTLKVEPAFDGMIAADGKLFITNKDGSVVCYK